MKKKKNETNVVIKFRRMDGVIFWSLFESTFEKATELYTIVDVGVHAGAYEILEHKEGTKDELVSFLKALRDEKGLWILDDPATGFTVFVEALEYDKDFVESIDETDERMGASKLKAYLETRSKKREDNDGRNN